MRVPVLEGQDVAPAPMPTPYSSTSAAGVARSLEGMSGTLNDIREKVTADRASRADADFGNAINDANYSTEKEATPGDVNAAVTPTGLRPVVGSGQPKGFMWRQGENAIDPSAHLKAIQDKARDIEASLSDNPEAQRLFRMRAMGRMAQARAQAEEHSGQQIRAVAMQTAQAQEKLALDDAAHAQGTPDQVLHDADLAWHRAVGPVAHQLKFNEGRPDTDVQAYLVGLRGRIYSTAIESYLNLGHGMDAMDLFEKVKDKLGPEGPKLEARIRPLADAQRAGLEAGTAVDIARGKDGRVNLTAGEEYLNKELKADDLAKQRAITEFRSRARVENLGAQEADEQALGRIGLRVFDARAPVVDQAHLQALSDYDKLSDENKLKAVKMLDSRQNELRAQYKGETAQERAEAREARREQRELESGALNEFKTLPTDEQVAAKAADYPQLVTPNGRAAFKLIQKKAQALIDKGEASNDGEFKSYVTAYAKEHGYGKTKASDFGAAMVEWREKWLETNKGKKPSRADVDKAISDETEAGYSHSIGPLKWGTKRRFEAEKEAKKSGEPVEFEARPQEKPAAATPATAPAPKSDTVKIKAKDGTVGTIPAANLDKAKQRGAVVIE